MTLPEFNEALDRYGGDISSWPVAIRSAAAKLLEDSTAAAAARDDMAIVERILRQNDPGAGESASEIAARAVRYRQQTMVARLLPRAGWAAVAAATLCLGAYIGQVAQRHEHRSSYIMSMAFPSLEDADVD